MIARIVVTALVIACASLALAAYGSAATDTNARTSAAAACERAQIAVLYPTAAEAATMPAADREVIASACRGR